MSASFSAASSTTLSRSRAAVILVTAIAAAYGIYYIRSSYSHAEEPATPPSNTGLHRSNAISRRHSNRRSRRNASNSFTIAEDEPSVFGEEITEIVEEPAAIRPLTDGETVEDDDTFRDDFSWAGPPPGERQGVEATERNGQNITQLLFRVSEDATRRNAYVHRGCGCNACGVVPIRGIRYRCANCADFDLCEGCESQGLHTKTHIFYKVRIPAPSFGPRQIQPVWYSGDPDARQRNLPRETVAKLIRETGFERHELDAYWEQWTFLATTDWRDDPDDINLAMDRRTFERCLVPSGGYRHAAPSLIFDRMFAFYDTNKDDLIGFSEFLHGLAYRKKKDKWKRIFEGYDIDEDGFVERKDFLRMFRSYYVLCRQMHRDMLEGLDDQQMSSTDAHSLVNSRQPLSSAFGQDGRYPSAPDPRTGEGKSVRPNGELEVVDGKGVINESGNDTSNKEDIFKWPYPPLRRASRGYWDAMLNPPTTPEQMPDLINRLARARQEFGEQDDGFSFGVYLDNENIAAEEGHDFLRDEDVEAVSGQGATLADMTSETRPAVTRHAWERIRAQRAIHERWRRRQFYTDEEEGATTPADWNEDEDILTNNGIGESSKPQAQARPSYHSRSSSKVRFAEDMDDFDTRSNPSTSSRSVPERWGGIEIPDAEKDAGKEILYQVTQQAFNELLDPLFKDLEDLAIEVAITKEERDQYRHLFTAPDFVQWAKTKTSQEEKTQKLTSVSTATEQNGQPWDQAAVHYTIEEPDSSSNEERPNNSQYSAPTPPNPLPTRDASDLTDLDINDIAGDEDFIRALHSAQETLGPEDLYYVTPRASVSNGNNESASSIHTTPPSSESPPKIEGDEDGEENDEGDDENEEDEEDEKREERDPTMPQFRPNSLPSTPSSSVPFIPPPPPRNPRQPFPNPQWIRSSSNGTKTRYIPPQASWMPNLPSSPPKKSSPLPPPPKTRLYHLYHIDSVVTEAQNRGGFGRLNLKEFEERVKEHTRKWREGNRDGRSTGKGDGTPMDYLGSWIEFCIP